MYLPATKLNTDNGAIVDAVFRQAESVGLLSDSSTFRALHEIRVDMHRGVQAISEVLGDLGDRAWAVEQRVSKWGHDMSCLRGSVESLHFVESLHSVVSNLSVHQNTFEDAMVNLSGCLKQLQSLIRNRDRRLRYAWIVRCILSFIPVVGAAIFDIAIMGTEIFMDLTVRDWVGIGADVAKNVIPEMAFVDLSNFQVARLTISDKVMANIGPEAQTTFATAISTSGFDPAKVFEGILRVEIEFFLLIIIAPRLCETV